MSRVVVIGAGLAGLTAALRLARAGVGVTLVSKGVGGLQLSQGTVDVLGYLPAGDGSGVPGAEGTPSRGRGGPRVTEPLAAIAELASADPKHPYALIGADAVRAGVSFLQAELGELLVGEPDNNRFFPTAVGAVRPTCLVQPSMLAGECVSGARFAIVGLRRLKDFHPALIAGNLARTDLPGGGRLQARALFVDVPARAGEADSSGLAYARSFDHSDFRDRFVAELQPLLTDGETVGLPAVLGLKDRGAWRDLEQKLGHPVFEIPLPPPAVPGMRLNEALVAAAQAAGVRFIRGSWVQAARIEDGRVTAVTVGTSGRSQDFPADAVVHAAGGFESGTLTLDSHGRVSEAVFGLPLAVPAGAGSLVHGDYWGAEQPLFKVGVAVDETMRVVPASPDQDGGTQETSPCPRNLWAAGGILAGAVRWQEKSGEGIAVGSAVKAADAIVEELA